MDHGWLDALNRRSNAMRHLFGCHGLKLVGFAPLSGPIQQIIQTSVVTGYDSELRDLYTS